MKLPTPAPSWLRARVAIPAALCLIQVAAAVVLASTLPEIQPMDLRGKVHCSSGRAVQGIWIEGFSGGSQFAQVQADTGSVSFYTYQLPYGGKYQVRVGCGGTPADWTVEARSPYVNGAELTFTCQDISTEPAYKTCSLG